MNYLDVFLGGEDHRANDVEKLLSMILYRNVGENEESYSMRYFVWDEIWPFTSLQELKTVVCQADLISADEIVHYYRSTLRNIQIAHPEWRSPSISMICAETGRTWRNLELEEAQ